MKIEDLNLVVPEDETALNNLWRRWTPGESGSAARVRRFTKHAIFDFDSDLSRADRASTSQLSPHIHYGEVSVRLIWHLSYQIEREERKGGGAVVHESFEKFRRNLGYREYSRYLSYHYP